MSNVTKEHAEQAATRAADLTETSAADSVKMGAAELTGTGAAGIVFESAFCGSLRSKKFFMRDGMLATEASHYLDASNHCWCRETQQVVGPDGGRAQPARCVSGRSCYISALEG
jgi:hypothetical protein